MQQQSPYICFMLTACFFSCVLTEGLQETLLKNYSTKQPPLSNRTRQIYVEVHVELLQILEINDDEQFLKARINMIQRWYDKKLRWNESQWDGRKTILLARESIWVPDITLQNNVAELSREAYQTDVKVYSNGMILWHLPLVLTSSCPLNLKHFPFDKHMCKLAFSSLMYNHQELKISAPMRSVVSPSYIPSASWELQKDVVMTTEKSFPSSNERFSTLSIKLSLKRKSSYYVSNFIVPSIILVANIFIGFYLKPDGGERMFLTIIIFLSVTIFLQFVTHSIPKNSKSVSMLSAFYILILMECALSVFSTCVVLLAYQQSNCCNVRRIPRLVALVFIKCIGKLLQVRREDGKNNKIEYCGNPIDLIEIKKKVSRKELKELDHEAFHNARSMKLLNDIVDELQKMRALMLRKEESKEIQDLRMDWKYLAKILDRFFFWILLVFLVCIVIGIAISANS